MQLPNFEIKLRAGTAIMFDDVHATSATNVIKGMAAHINNEVASKVQGRIERDARSGIVRDTKESKEKGLTPTKGEDKVRLLDAFRDKHGADVDVWIKEAEAAAIAALRDGTFRAPRVGTGERGYTRLQTLMRVNAKIYAMQKLGREKMPKLDDEIKLAHAPWVEGRGAWDGTFNEFVDVLCEVAPEAEKWRKDAERKIREEDKVRDAAKADGFDIATA